jgi:hypothetical protein
MSAADVTPGQINVNTGRCTTIEEPALKGFAKGCAVKKRLAILSHKPWLAFPGRMPQRSQLFGSLYQAPQPRFEI